MELFFDLAKIGERARLGREDHRNSFMKREFGNKLIEEFLPTSDLRLVVDTSGAYIPGHGTPTVILFGRNQPPVGPTVRAVMGIRGEPSTPRSAKGLVWSAITEHIDSLGWDDGWITVDRPRQETPSRSPLDTDWWRCPRSEIATRRCVRRCLQPHHRDWQRRGYPLGFRLPLLVRWHAASASVSTCGIACRSSKATSRGIGGLPSRFMSSVALQVSTLQAEVNGAISVMLWPYRIDGNPCCLRETQLERGLAWFDHSMFFASVSGSNVDCIRLCCDA